MAKLPFVVEPRLKPIIEEIGSEESGKIQIERRGYLTSGEKAFFQQIKQSDQGTGKLIALSRKISRDLKIEMTKAYEVILRVLSGSSGEEPIDIRVENDYAEELAVILQDLTAGQTSDELVMAACLIRYRIDSEFQINEIMKLHPDIISGLAELYRDEDEKSVDRLMKDEETKDGKEASLEKVAKKSSPRTAPTT
jgi:hypothetical protein